jgi:hypothetical protein
MNLRQFVSVFGGFGLFMGGLGAVQLYLVTDGNLVGSLIALLLGLSLGLLLGMYRVLQLRFKVTRASAEDSVPIHVARASWSLENLALILLSLLPMIAAILDAPPVVALALVLPPLALLIVRSKRHSDR